MCNLYAARVSADEAAAHFGVSAPISLEFSDEVRPGASGLIMREGRSGRVLQSLRWGFPYPQQLQPNRPSQAKPVNLVANLTSPMWKKIVSDPRYRCIIPLTAFAEPEGMRGSKTRTWFSIPEEPILGWAGFCRNTLEEGPVYAGMTCESTPQVAPLNPRMPVLLRREEYDSWLHGSVQDVIAFQLRECPFTRFAIDRTDEPWVPRQPRPGRQSALL
jgi:putative SOS response-associated peptidase YedK